jgi:glycosyltransferase involved in cell wall biosynthesis
MHIAMIGTRGVPARYGGFETAVEEIGRRLVEAGHEVTVYCREYLGESSYLGMRRVELPSVRSKSLETLTNTAIAATHAARKTRPDVAFMFNAANSPWIPVLHARGIPVALHTDGLEWKRSKWGRAGRRYYLRCERLGVRFADALISDAQGIADYYQSEYGATSKVIAYGAATIDPPVEPIQTIGLQSKRYVLIVARFEPENHVLEGLRGAMEAQSTDPIVIVGSSPYADDYTASVHAAAGDDPRVRFLGGVWDQCLLDALYGHARMYIHGHSVGGTNPSLLRAMGAGAAVAAFDVTFNREVLGSESAFWSTPTQLALHLDRVTDASTSADGAANQLTIARKYRWDEVAAEYEAMAVDLLRRGTRRSRRKAGQSDLGVPARTPGTELQG